MILNILNKIRNLLYKETYIDINKLKSTPKLSQEERINRYKQGRVAEITLEQAGE